MSALFQDLTVIDAASYLAAPGAATILGDYGANVIKVEAPAGDAYRLLHGRHPVDYNWLLTSRNKRSIALDLRVDAGRAVLDRLLEEADVLILNFRVSELERLGLRYEDLNERYPRLIYAHLSGYGPEGDEANRKAFDASAWFARTGVLDLMHDKDIAPQLPAGGVGDHASAVSLFAGIVMALYRRQNTGAGGKVETSLAANGVWAMGMHLQGALEGHDLSAIRDAKGYGSPFMKPYPTADQRHVLLAMANAAKEWPGLLRALDLEQWLSDPRLATMGGVMKERSWVVPELSSRTSALTLTELCQRLDDNEVTHSVIAKLSEVVQDPQLIANGIIRETGQASQDYRWTVSNPINLSEEPHREPQRAPDLGADTFDILRAAGFSDPEMQQLIDTGAVQAPER